jgi:predicted transcriptional regulator
MNSDRNAPYLTAQIVSKYVGHNQLPAGQLPQLITTVHQAIRQLGQATEPEEVLTPAVSVRRSVQHDYVVCMDCGYPGKTLRRHINVRHGLTPDEYRQRWGLKSSHPITAPAYSARRSSMARALGLGRQPSVNEAPTETPAAPEPETQPAPKRRPRTRRATAAPADVARDAVAAAPTPARRGTPRSRARVASRPGQAASPTAES